MSKIILLVLVSIGAEVLLLTSQQDPRQQDEARPAEVRRQRQPTQPNESRQLMNTLRSLQGRLPGETAEQNSDLEIQKAIRAYLDSADENKSVARENLRELLAEKYDEFLEQQQQEIDQLKERIGKLEEHLQRRREAKDRMVDLRLEMTISELDGLGWPMERNTLQGRPITLGRNYEVYPSGNGETILVPHVDRSRDNAPTTPAFLPPARANELLPRSVPQGNEIVPRSVPQGKGTVD